MTRINVGVDPRALCDEHLRAEYRELPRIYPIALRYAHIGHLPANAPYNFKLGTGHMLFFADKGEYLRMRWNEIRCEMSRRGFTMRLSWRPWPLSLAGEWTAGACDRALVVSRISQRLRAMKRIHYYSTIETSSAAILRLGNSSLVL